MDKNSVFKRRRFPKSSPHHAWDGCLISDALYEAILEYDPNDTRPQKAEFWEFHDPYFKKLGRF